MAEQEKTKIKIVGTNNGYQVKANGIVELKIICDSSQLAQVIKMLFSLIAKEFQVAARGKDKEEIMKMGKFTIHAIKIDGDGEAAIVLHSDIDSADISVAGELYEEQEIIKFMFVA